MLLSASCGLMLACAVSARGDVGFGAGQSLETKDFLTAARSDPAPQTPAPALEELSRAFLGQMGEENRAIVFRVVDRSRGEASLERINAWVREIHALPYEFKSDWRTPCETNRCRRADCKEKSVLLLEKLKVHGVDARLVIGWADVSSEMLHAWVRATVRGRTYVLDATNAERARTLESIGATEYLPLFVY